MTHRKRLATAAAVAAVALTGCGVSDPYSTTVTKSVTAAQTSSVAAPPKLSEAQINEQDSFTPQQQRDQERAMKTRPLLNQLPLVEDGVTIDIDGLAEDGKTTVVSLATKTRTEKQAKAIYRRVLRRFKDTGTAYDVIYLR